MSDTAHPHRRFNTPVDALPASQTFIVGLAPRSRTPLADAARGETVAGAIARVLRERDIPVAVFERWLGEQMDVYTGDDHG